MFTTHQYKKSGLDRGRERLKKAKQKLEKEDGLDFKPLRVRRSEKNRQRINSAIANAGGRGSIGSIGSIESFGSFETTVCALVKLHAFISTPNFSNFSNFSVT